jgi:hypothetical protein
MVGRGVFFICWLFFKDSNRSSNPSEKQKEEKKQKIVKDNFLIDCFFIYRFKGLNHRWAKIADK